MAAVSLSYPFTGRWLVQNSPSNRVPSHGTSRFGTAFAIDFVPLDARGRSAPMTWGMWVRPEPPHQFNGFGATILAPCAGVVVATQDDAVDHDAYRGLPSVGYALTQRHRVRHGWRAVAGNHVIVEMRGGVLVAVCHLRQGSITVEVGQALGAGEVVGQCGNSGNSTEPHLHLQAVDSLDMDRATGLPVTFSGGLPRNGDIVEAP